MANYNVHIFLLYQIIYKPKLYIFLIIYKYKILIHTHTVGMKNKVGQYRYKQNLSLNDLATRSGLSITSLYKLENGLTNDIMLSHAITLSKILKVDLYELFCIKK